MSALRHGGGRPIAVSIFLLVLAALVTTAVIHFIVTFHGPPPDRHDRSPAALAQQLRGVRFGSQEGPGLRLEVARVTPTVYPFQHRHPVLSALVARELRVPDSEVYAFGGIGPGLRPWREEAGLPPALYSGNMIAVAWHHGGEWRVLREPPLPLMSPWHRDTLTAMLIALVVLGIGAWLFSRAISRPLTLLTATAERARATAPLGPLPTGGAAEVRRLSAAIARMHDRLTRHASARTAMLGGIAHDLGTPLARLAFRIESLPDGTREKAVADLAEMRAMIAATLRLARDEASERTDQRVDLGSLLDSLVANLAETGQPVTLEPGERIVVTGDPQALRRLFTNLIENAVRYGKQAAVGWRRTAAAVEVTVDDDGPGFGPDAQRLFDPFVRGDPSRNRDTGGTGLGLAIARSVAEAHDGQVLLEDRGGGGRVRVVLPIFDTK